MTESVHGSGNSGRDPVTFLEGERISLCPLRREDAHQYTIWLNDDEVSQFLLMHQPLTLEAELEFLDRVLTQKVDEGVILGIWLQQPRKLIGGVGLHAIHRRDRHAELGVFIGEKEQWAKGLGPEAMRLLIRYGFDTLNLRKILLCHYSHNARGRAAYDKLGFQEVGRLKEHRWIAGAWRDEHIMEIFRDEFHG
jgi:RimJ/RimL family protein N-acetyltransferase